MAASTQETPQSDDDAAGHGKAQPALYSSVADDYKAVHNFLVTSASS
jgi:hypothetical protein